MMPLRRQIYSFRALPTETFYGLPGMLTDSLPDNFGNKRMNPWLLNFLMTFAALRSAFSACPHEQHLKDS